MIVKFNSPHLSITSLNEVDLPALTVLTGVNGSGKTHFLQAIQGRSIIIDGIDQNSIITFNYETFRLDNESPFSAHEIAQEKMNAYQFFDGQIRNNLRSWRGTIANDYATIQNVAKERNVPYWSIRDNAQLQQYKSQISQYFDQQPIKQQQYSGPLLSLIKSSSKTIDEITKEEFYEQYKPLMYKNDFLPQAIGRVIWDYYVRFTQNELNGYRNATQGTSLPFLSNDDFVRKNGEKPWDVINNILKQFSSLEYQLVSPEGLDIFESYQLRLENIYNRNLRIDFSSLSSGERVLMALVASVYKSASDNNFPDLLLLDELDATLHPSMMKNMLAVVSDVFVGRGTKVIMVTHSPSTVAYAPEESIFVMNKRGSNRIEKRSKKDALSILTEGFATLDEGMLLFDQVVSGAYSIMTEGRNTRLLKEAFKHLGITGINVIDGLEGQTGKNQLKTLYDFMCKVPHKESVIFVWDCDVSYNLREQNNTFPFVLPRNPNNTVSKSGIENMFDESLFSGFTKTIIMSKGNTIVEFDETRKKDFEEYIISRNNADDFKGFHSIVDEINRVRAIMGLSQAGA